MRNDCSKQWDGGWKGRRVAALNGEAVVAHGEREGLAAGGKGDAGEAGADVVVAVAHRGVVLVDQRAVWDGARVEREPGGGGGPGQRRATGASVEGGVEPRAGAAGSRPHQRRRLNDSGFRD